MKAPASYPTFESECEEKEDDQGEGSEEEDLDDTGAKDPEEVGDEILDLDEEPEEPNPEPGEPGDEQQPIQPDDADDWKDKPGNLEQLSPNAGAGD